MSVASLSLSGDWALALLGLLPLLWWASLRSRTNLTRRHLVVASALRSLALTAAVLALTRPVWTAPAAEVSVVYALDVSRSVAPGFVRSALQFIERADREANPAAARYVVFADGARLLKHRQDVAGVAVTTATGASQAGLLYQGATNLEIALDEALLGLDSDRIKRVVLFSDGNETAGDAWRVIPRLVAEHVRVFAFPAAPRTRADAWVEAIDLPDSVHRDEPVKVTVRVLSQRHVNARVSLAIDHRPLTARTVVLAQGTNPVPLPARFRRSGAAVVSVEVHAQGDDLPDNDRLEQSVWVEPRPRVLYVEGQPEAGKYLRDALTREGLDVTLEGPQRLPAQLTGLERFDAVILSDVSPTALDSTRMRALQTYVQERGGGLVLAAGENTYGEGGFSGSPLERILPVEFKAQDKRKDLALVVCLDRSYSMKGRPIALAKAGARASLEVLDEQHYFGVIAFDSQPYEAVPLQYVRDKLRAENLIDRIQASGQTNIYPALAAAWRMLQNNPARRKHVILLSDGDTAPADFERLVKRMTDAKITLSTVAIGRTGDPALMAKLAEMGHGKAYVAEDIGEVPQIFVEDTRNVSRVTLKEEPFHPVVKHGIEALRGLDFAKAPPLRGFVSTKAKEDAEVFLTTDADAPILARWQYGLGRTVVFASDAKDRWAAEWLKWDGYGRFWSQLIRDTLRRDTREQVVFRVQRDGDEAQVRLELMSEQGAWRNGLSPYVRVTDPAGTGSDLALRQVGSGEYVARLQVATAGSHAYGFALTPKGGLDRDTVQRAGTRQLFYPYPDELRNYPPDLALLGALAAQTGGKLGATVPEIFAARGDYGHSRAPLWPWLAAAGLVLYLCDLAVRRVTWIRRWLE